MKDDFYDLMSKTPKQKIGQKLIIVLNGAGGVGKDTICNIVAERYNCVNESSIDPIKEIARKYGGWSGEKDEKSRKFLSDLKLIFSDYNNLPLTYMLEKTRNFLANTEQEIMFVHIREPKEIATFVSMLEEHDIKCITLLIKGKSEKQWGNMADDNVENYSYDYKYNNITTLQELPKSFMLFFKAILEIECEEVLHEYRKYVSRRIKTIKRDYR